MPIYLDHNATAIPLPAAAAAAAAWLARPANPSSVHGPGRAARAAVETARRQVAGAIGGDARGVVFTSGATEALHLAVGGLVPRGGHVVASAVEHPALFGAAAVAEVALTRVAVDGAGRLDVDAVVAACRPDTALVAVMAAQNELGTLYPVAEIARRVAPIPVLCDAVQALGKVPLDVSTLGCAAVAVSGHKIGAPAGVGALWLAPGVDPRPRVMGGAQERGRRAGTENVAGIVGFGVAAAAVPARLGAMPSVAVRRDRIAAALGAALPWVGHGAPGLPNTLAGRVVGVDGDVLLQALDLEGVALSSGAACAAGGIEPSPVLLALGLSPRDARGGLRISLGAETRDDEVEVFVEVFVRVARRALAAGRGEGA
ncbi:MAG: cysteine desulfurase family protein [bacterium]